MSTPKSLEFVNMSLYIAKRAIQIRMVKLRTLGQEDYPTLYYPGFLGWPNVITRVLKNVPEIDVKQKQNQREILRCYLSGFEDSGMGLPVKKCRQLLTSGIGKGMNFFLEPLEGTQPCHHLNFSPVKPILYFLPSRVMQFLF